MSATDLSRFDRPLINQRRTGPRGRALLALLCLASASVCIGLGGCASAKPASAGLSANFGSSVEHNRTAQFVAPAAEQKANTYIPPNPARQRLALETYEAGEVELETVNE